MDGENCRHLTVVGLHDTGPKCKSLVCLHQKKQETIHDPTLSSWTLDRETREAVGFSRPTTVCLVGWLLNVPVTGYSVSQGQICSDNCMCCHTEIEVADQTFLSLPVTLY